MGLIIHKILKKGGIRSAVKWEWDGNKTHGIVGIKTLEWKKTTAYRNWQALVAVLALALSHYLRRYDHYNLLSSVDDK